MTTLSINLGPSGTEPNQQSNQKIDISHFRFNTITAEDAREGLRPAPGILIVMPRQEQETFLVNGKPFISPPGVALLLNGESKNVLASGEDAPVEDNRQTGLGVIEINATINDSFRLRDKAKPPSWLNIHDSKMIADLYHDQLFKGLALGHSLDKEQEYTISMYLAGARIVNLILDSADHKVTTPSSQKPDIQRDRLRKYLLANLSNRINTDDMASHLGITRAYFCRLAKSLLGEAPMSYLRRIRLESSLELLEHTSLSIDTVAEEVGYGDRFSFSKEFKRRYGCSPVQYRKGSRTTLQAESHAKAQALFENGRYEQALSVCDRTLQKATEESDQAQTIFLLGRCLVALGRRDDAFAAWSQLQDYSYAWQAGLQRCKLYFQNSQYDNVLEELDRLWSKAEGMQHGDVIQLWAEHVATLIAQRRREPILHYLTFRKQRFANDQESKMVAVHACRNTGDEMAILDHCRDDEGVRFRALRGAGEYERALALYGSTADQKSVAYILLASGRYDELLSMDPGYPEYNTRALIQLGRPEEAVRRFPENCSLAYLALRQYEKVLSSASETSYEYLHALYALGRVDEIKSFDIEGTWLWHNAQLYVRPEYLLQADYQESDLFIPKARLLLAFQSDSDAEALQHIDAIPKIDSADFWPGGQDNVTLLLRHVLPALLGKKDNLQNDLKRITEELRFLDKQMLYYDAAFLLGEIDLDAWLQQPHQIDITARGQFIQALTHDLAGQVKDSRRLYHEYVEGNPVPYNLIQHRFAEWRMHKGRH
jgi:AraC-like DNA-binding protein